MESKEEGEEGPGKKGREESKIGEEEERIIMLYLFL